MDLVYIGVSTALATFVVTNSVFLYTLPMNTFFITILSLFGVLFLTHFLTLVVADTKQKACYVMSALASAFVGVLVFIFFKRLSKFLPVFPSYIQLIVLVTGGVVSWHFFNTKVLRNKC